MVTLDLLLKTGTTAFCTITSGIKAATNQKFCNEDNCAICLKEYTELHLNAVNNEKKLFIDNMDLFVKELKVKEDLEDFSFNNSKVYNMVNELNNFKYKYEDLKQKREMIK